MTRLKDTTVVNANWTTTLFGSVWLDMRQNEARRPAVASLTSSTEREIRRASRTLPVKDDGTRNPIGTRLEWQSSRTWWSRIASLSKVLRMVAPNPGNR